MKIFSAGKYFQCVSVVNYTEVQFVLGQGQKKIYNVITIVIKVKEWTPSYRLLIIKSPSGCASCAVANKGTLKDSFT
jgi:hypothetical protein